MHRSYITTVGGALIRSFATAHGLISFALITLGVMVTRFQQGKRVIRPLIREQIYRAGIRLLPMITFLGLALGFVVIGQTVALLSRVNVTDVAGRLMVTVVVRELGPMITALIVLARVGTANVVELGTSRAQGEVEALEALNIDPIHFLVIPRVIGISVAVFALTVYLIITTLVSGYLFIFLNDVPLLPGEYFRQLAASLIWEDFALLGMKTVLFGYVIALTTSFRGLAQPLRLEDVARASTSAVVTSVAACVLIDALFIVVYLVT